MSKSILSVLLCLWGITAFSQLPTPKIELVRQRFPDGSETVYVTIDSLKQGLCIDYDSLGRKSVECCYVNNQETGPIIFYYPDGTIGGESYRVNGRTHGKTISYYRDGTIKSISHSKMGLDDGIYETYMEDGTLDKRFLFRNDTLIRILVDNHQMPLPPMWEPLEKD